MSDKYQPPHVRSVELQTLDALLRIEETLEKLRVDFLRTRREQLTATGSSYEILEDAKAEAASAALKASIAADKVSRGARRRG